MLDDKIFLFPNPAKNFITIKAREIHSIYIFDEIGNLVIYRDGANMSEIKMDISALNNCLYLVQVVTAKNCRVQKLILNN